ncbi:hypothetical protein D9615_010053 [Tricholomella constricta]|uniref:Uncharacterized protein n=1 Tax=Tricholomella constricta TaxID=117010 RepID=A0A8H5LUN0_9AGAR|nr:hypothetical protein D9615_010053 [Tricholomella constricta]
MYRGTDILLTAQEVLDPVALLREYVAKCDLLHGGRPALFLCEDGSHPTRSWFEHKFSRVLGWDFGGHSLRAGGATFYAGLGLSKDVIQALGRWSSSAEDLRAGEPSGSRRASARFSSAVASFVSFRHGSSLSHLFPPPSTPQQHLYLCFYSLSKLLATFPNNISATS